MGFLDRIRARSGAARTARNPLIGGPSATSTEQRQALASASETPMLMGGYDTLEVVGESFNQDHLWRVVGGLTAERVRFAVRAILEPEPHNPHDSNAVRVVIAGGGVGHLSREDAANYLPGLRALIERHDRQIALQGAVVGGGPRADGIGMLGVFLDHDPSDFGVRRHQATHIGELRTGLAQAIATDVEDDSYDLSWLDQLAGGNDPRDIVTLRSLLEHERDLIDRHFMFTELEARLYRSRDAFASALDEFDAACEQHHSELPAIRAALVAKFGCVPVIDVYRQAAIRCQKARDWERALRWAERGLAMYAADAGRPEAVADLQKRLAHAEAKRTAAVQAARRPSATASRASQRTTGMTETLTCLTCGETFLRERTRGRKPGQCPNCRAR